MASSSNQKLAAELLEAVEDFDASRLSASSIEQLLAEVKDVARRLGAPTPIPVRGRRLHSVHVKHLEAS